MRRTLTLLFTVGWLSAGATALAQQPSALPPRLASQVPKQVTDKVQLLSGNTGLIVARNLGMTQIAGKPVDPPEIPGASLPSLVVNDVGIGVHPSKHENEPTVVANPRNRRQLVAGSHFFGEPLPLANRCVAYTSSDGGATWSAGIPMPHLHPRSACSDPVLAYAPDGSRIYYAYMDIKFIFAAGPPENLSIDLDIVVSYSDNNGASWTGPIVALDAIPTIIVFTPDFPTVIPGFIYDKPWIGTHIDRAPLPAGQSNFVYVSTTRFDDFFPFDCHIVFTRSGTKGTASSWTPPMLLDSSSNGCQNPVVVQGSRPAGGAGSNVIVAWYNSGPDGWLNGSFKIRTARSGNRGLTFNPAVDAANDSFEAPFFLGPFGFYYRWWFVMGPDVEFGAGSTAHIVYTHDPAPNSNPSASETPEDGDIRYIRSPAPPYTLWSSPVTVNDDGLVRAQGFPALKTQGGTLHLIWEDHRLSPELPISFPESPNLFYDIFYSKRQSGALGLWLANQRVSDVSSISDFIFIGDYYDLATSSDLVFGIWTDRRHQESIFKFEDNVFGSLITTGGAP